MWISVILLLLTNLFFGNACAQQLPPDFLEKMATLGEPLTQHVLVIDVDKQKLKHFFGNALLATYPISTGHKGTGQEENSFQTPLGIHRIAKKIGEKALLYTIFVARENTGKIWKGRETDADLILTRILWLEGLEKGYNKGISATGKNVDSFNRYIYIHGTNEEKKIGSPASKGCIRMNNADLVALFNQVELGSLVYITLF